MIRFLSIILLTVATTATADQSMLFAPSGAALPSGNYRLLVIPADATLPPTSTVLPVGGGAPYVPPVVIPPVVPPVIIPPVTPPVDTLTAQIDAAIAMVITDPDKAVTAKVISDGYKLALGYAATFSKPDTFRQLIELGTDMGLKQGGKTASWQPYVDATAALTASMTMPELVNFYTLAAGRLASPTVPPIVPPIQPPVIPPTTTATAAVYVYEQRDNSIPRPVAVALQQLNAGDSGVVCSEFDDDTLNGLDQTPKQFRTALEAARAAGIPCLVVLSGDTVLKVVPNPQTAADVTGAIQ